MPIPNPIAFTIFNLDIRWYAILVTLGIVVAGCLIYFRAPKHELEGDKLFNFMIICVPVAIIGARAYYVIFNWNMYSGDIFKIINTRAGGLAIHGGLIAGFGMCAILCYIWHVRPLNLLDLCAPAVAMGQCIGRWGNYFNSEAHGGPTDLPFAVTVDGATYHPTFLYESIWCFILFWILLYIDNHRKFEGQTILLYGILYSIERFLVEGLRTDSLMIGSLRQAQVISIVIIVVCGLCYFLMNRRAQKR
ncbi:MAG: prolipoprotein diacylglyceryl transferase [Firmicutes bacterium]|nr:prolipoprotein diacylglyceryl transferase [Bacillota bacterium]